MDALIPAEESRMIARSTSTAQNAAGIRVARSLGATLVALAVLAPLGCGLPARHSARKAASRRPSARTVRPAARFR